jgi:ParB-like chromosome segregation protein Spo0J
MGAVRRVTGVKKAGTKIAVPKRKLRLEYVPISELKAWKKNPRRNDAAAEKLTGLLSEYGFINPIIATPDKVIRAGHTRLKAAANTDLTELPVIYVDFGSEAKAEMFALADNRASEWAEWDEDALADLLSQRKELPDQKMAALSGFERTEIEGLRAGGALGADAPEEFPEVDENIETQHQCPKCKYEWSGKSR